MATRLEKPLKREVEIDGRLYMVTIAPEGIRVVLKGHRRGTEVAWDEILSGEVTLHSELVKSLERTAEKPGRSRARSTPSARKITQRRNPGSTRPPARKKAR